MTSKHKENGKTPDGPLAEFGSFTADDLADKFHAECMRVYSDGASWYREPGELASIVLPEGVLPDLTQLANPLTRRVVPVVRVALFVRADVPPLNPSSEIREALVAAGWTPPEPVAEPDAADLAANPRLRGVREP